MLESRCTRLAGQHARATITAMLAIGSKPCGPFTRVDKETYTLADVGVEPHKPSQAQKRNNQLRRTANGRRAE